MEISSHLVRGITSSDLFGIKIRGSSHSLRRPTHFILLLDTSGSMDFENRLESVKTCAKYMLNFMNYDDRLSIVRFDDDASIVVNSIVTSSENRVVVESYINSIQTGGSTNMSAGLLKVRELLDSPSPSGSPSSGSKVGLILLTDGEANMGVQDESGLCSIVNLIRRDHSDVSVSCVGYGEDHQASLLRSLSLEGGGSYNVVTKHDHIGPVFGEILGGLISCVAQNVEIEYPSSWENCSSYVSRDNRLFVGDIYSESEVIVLLRPVSGGSVTLKGFNCIQMEDIVQSLGVSGAPIDNSNSLFAPYKIYYIRWSLAKILDKAADPNMNRTNLLADLDSVEQLLNDPNASAAAVTTADPMTLLLRQEFVTIRKMLQGHRINAVASAQRSAFLGTGRGANSASQGTAGTFNQDPTGVSVAFAATALNSTQRGISAAMTPAVAVNAATDIPDIPDIPANAAATALRRTHAVRNIS